MQMLLRHSSLGRFQLRSITFFGRPELQNRNWKRDVVYLYQFPRSPVIPNMSPFCMKVETFLRAHNIKYEAFGAWTIRSKEGRLPFVELNGQQIADSQWILWYLMKHFEVEYGLSAGQSGIVRAVERMLEDSTYYATTYFRFIEHVQNTVNPNVSGLPIPEFVAPYFAKKIRQNAESRLRSNGISRYPRDIIIEILRRDVEAVDNVLGDKKFLIGVRPTIADFALFAHLGVGYYMPFRQPITDMLDDEFPRVRLLLERIRVHYWSDFKWPVDKN